MDVRRLVQGTELARVRAVPLGPVRHTAAPAQADDRGSMRVAISKPASLLSKLSALQGADETRFKHFMGEVGSNLKAAASAPSGAVGEQLDALADQLLQVAKTGDLSTLQPAATRGAGLAARVLEAYRRHTPTADTRNSHLAQALDYVRSAAEQE